MGRTTYIGFFIDCSFQFIATAACYLIIIAGASVYVGIFHYINAMVKDMKMQMLSIEYDSSIVSSQQDQTWLVYVQEVMFHVEVIRYIGYSILISFKRPDNFHQLSTFQCGQVIMRYDGIDFVQHHIHLYICDCIQYVCH